jgi:Apea-like HEPN
VRRPATRRELDTAPRLLGGTYAARVNNKARERLTGRLLSIAHEAKAGSAPGLSRSFDSLAGWVGFEADTDAKFKEVVRLLFEEQGWGEKLSETEIVRRLMNLVGLLIKDNDPTKARGRFDALVAEFTSFKQEQIVFVPIVNLEMTLRSLALGQVTMKPVTKKLLTGLRDEIDTAFSKTKHPKEKRDEFAEKQIGRLRTDLGKVFAEFRVIAEPGRAGQRAEEEARRALDLLRFAGAWIWPNSYRITVGIDGDPVGRRIRTIPVIATDYTNFTWQMTLQGAIHPFRLTGETKNQMKKLRVFEMSQVLAKPANTLTDFERNVLQGIHWFGDSRVQAERENEILSLTSCLETFFTIKGEPIRANLAEGVAFVLAKGLADRKKLRERVKYLYGLRSTISHGGRTAILEEEAAELRLIAGNLLAVMIDARSKFASTKELLDWIDDQKLS